MDTDVLDILIGEEDLLQFTDDLLDSSVCPFTYTQGMTCPVLSCGFTIFATRKSYARHWDAKHKSTTCTFSCSIPGCSSSCKRWTDIKFHLRSIHRLQGAALENFLLQCQPTILPNKSFVDPGSYKFVASLRDPGTQPSVMPPPSEPPVQSTSSSSAPEPSVFTSPPSVSLLSSSISASLSTSMSSASTCTSSSAPSISTSAASCQTDILSFSSLPESREDLECFVSCISGEIERLERMREMARKRLSESSEIQRERELRRELEKENRRLKFELDSVKRNESERERLYFSRDERFEMYERPDGTLSCFKRDSTSLSERMNKRVELLPYNIYTEE